MPQALLQESLQVHHQPCQLFHPKKINIEINYLNTIEEIFITFGLSFLLMTVSSGSP